jgi:competence protein ComEC
LVAAGLVVSMLTRPPDLIVGRDGETIALRGHDGLLHLLRPAADTYSADEWLKRDGDARVADLAVASPADGVRCDEWGCVAQARDGETIAAPSRADALAEDCARADIVLSAVPTRHNCVGPKLVIDRFDVARNGAYALWFGKTLRVENAEAERGDRPWSARPTKRFSQATSE